MEKQHPSQGIILVVDDNPDNLGILFEYLNGEGFKVLLVQNSQEAQVQAETQHPDIILLDILMPGIDGFETCRRLKSNDQTREIPVIFMTALSDTLNKVRAFKSGGVDYITKPFQQEEVLVRVNTHMMLRRLQKQLEAKNVLLEQQVKQLQEMNASKDKFISIISHDLQSPFSSLRGLIQFTAENIDDYNKNELGNIMDMLGNSTDNLYALIENLLTWSRIQRGVLEHCPQQLDLREAILQNMALFVRNAEEKQITFTNHVTESLFVYADYNMIHAILRNLISNALKFSHPGGSVEFSAILRESVVEVAVTDHGIGIPPEHLPKLFRIDARYKRLGTAREKGTGLGLILCKEFVEKNGGTIWIESEIDHGTTVKFTLSKP
jgi:two-component system, sensor histidine kinase and response regulator